MTDREELARIIDPFGWREADEMVRDGLWTQERALSSGRLQSSLERADAILAAGWRKTTPVQQRIEDARREIHSGARPIDGRFSLNSPPSGEGQ